MNFKVEIGGFGVFDDHFPIFSLMNIVFGT